MPVAQEQHAGADAALTQGDGFFQGAERQETRPAGQSRLGHRQGSMAVALIFDNGCKLDAGGLGLENEFEIPLEFRQVNFDPGGACGEIGTRAFRSLGFGQAQAERRWANSASTAVGGSKLV